MLGKCNQKCFYCLGNEMPKAKLADYNNVHFMRWAGLGKFINVLKERDIDEIYLSSTTTEPLLYKYVDELVDFLHERGFKIGIRTNGTIYADVLKKLDAEISISINSFDDKNNKCICGCKNNYKKICEILENLRGLGKTIRLSILVNKYNVDEIDSILEKLSPYNDVIEYVQLRRWYTLNNTADNTPYDTCVANIKATYPHIGNFYESAIYDVHGTKVSLWNDVFDRESVKSVNYFPDGKMSDYNLLIPIYENDYKLM